MLFLEFFKFLNTVLETFSNLSKSSTTSAVLALVSAFALHAASVLVVDLAKRALLPSSS